MHISRLAFLPATLSLFTTASAFSWPFTSSSDLHISDSVTPQEQAVWDYRKDTVHGISLGGWFVLEPYITPSLFEQFGQDESKIPVDEYTFTKTLGKEKATTQLEHHWSTYYTEEDFQEIANYGLNLVRIPVGYWAFKLLPDDPYVQGQEKYLDQAIEWARRYRLKVWIDLHGVPGSQNGFDNSGKRGPIQWTETQENLDISAKALDYIFMKYSADAYSDTIIGLEVVNEPMLPALDKQKAIQFHYDRYYDFRERYKSNNYFLIQEGFMPLGWWDEQFNNKFPLVSQPYTTKLDQQLLQKNYFNGIVIDYHHYEVFTDAGVMKTSEERVLDIQNYAKAMALGQKFHPSLVGEWSAAITDCAKWLNGVGRGARYDDSLNYQGTTVRLNGTTSPISPGDSASVTVDWGLDGIDNEHRAGSTETNEENNPSDEEDEETYYYDADDYDYESDEEDENQEEYLVDTSAYEQDQSEDEEEDLSHEYASSRLVRRHSVPDQWIQASTDTDAASAKNMTVLAGSRTCANVRNYKDFTDQHKMEIRKFIEVQLIEYERHGSGWIFWNWKTENAIEWDFRLLVKNNLFPMPLSDYRYFYTNGTEVPERTSAAALSQLSLLASSKPLLVGCLVIGYLLMV